MRSLIVEDDKVSTRILSRVLTRYGECDQVIDGLEAVDAFLLSHKEKKPYDLICLDIMIPKLDGVKVLKAIRELETQKGILPKRRVKVVLITALAETNKVRDAFEIGCDGYFCKPVDLEAFIKLLSDLKLLPED